MSRLFRESSRAGDQAAGMNRARRGFAAALMVAVLATGLGNAHSPALAEETEATWTSSAHARGAGDAPVTAGVVLPPAGQPTCTGGGLSAPRINWAHGAPSSAREGYIIEVRRRDDSLSQAPVAVFTAGPNATSIQLTSSLLRTLENLLSVNRLFTATVRTQGPHNWTSVPSTGVNFSVALGLVATC